jgi:hypothetical protein
MQKAAAINTVSWISRSVAAALHCAGNSQERFELIRNWRSLRALLHIQDELLIAAKMISRYRAVNSLAEKAIVPRGNVSGDQLSLAGRQRTGTTQQDLRQLVQGLGRFRPKSHGSEDTG